MDHCILLYTATVVIVEKGILVYSWTQCSTNSKMNTNLSQRISNFRPFPFSMRHCLSMYLKWELNKEPTQTVGPTRHVINTSICEHSSIESWQASSCRTSTTKFYDYWSRSGTCFSQKDKIHPPTMELQQYRIQNRITLLIEKHRCHSGLGTILEL